MVVHLDKNNSTGNPTASILNNATPTISSLGTSNQKKPIPSVWTEAQDKEAKARAADAKAKGNQAAADSKAGTDKSKTAEDKQKKTQADIETTKTGAENKTQSAITFQTQMQNDVDGTIALKQQHEAKAAEIIAQIKEKAPDEKIDGEEQLKGQQQLDAQYAQAHQKQNKPAEDNNDHKSSEPEGANSVYNISSIGAGTNNSKPVGSSNGKTTLLTQLSTPNPKSGNTNQSDTSKTANAEHNRDRKDGKVQHEQPKTPAGTQDNKGKDPEVEPLKAKLKQEMATVTGLESSKNGLIAQAKRGYDQHNQYLSSTNQTLTSKQEEGKQAQEEAKSGQQDAQSKIQLAGTVLATAASLAAGFFTAPLAPPVAEAGGTAMTAGQGFLSAATSFLNTAGTTITNAVKGIADIGNLAKNFSQAATLVQKGMKVVDTVEKVASGNITGALRNVAGGALGSASDWSGAANTALGSGNVLSNTIDRASNAVGQVNNMVKIASDGISGALQSATGISAKLGAAGGVFAQSKEGAKALNNIINGQYGASNQKLAQLVEQVKNAANPAKELRKVVPPDLQPQVAQLAGLKNTFTSFTA